MSFEIITDAEKGISALIDPINGRALGPILSGPDAEKVLESFVGALGGDPALLPEWHLGTRWLQFVDALVDGADVEAHAEGIHAPIFDDAVKALDKVERIIEPDHVAAATTGMPVGGEQASPGAAEAPEGAPALEAPPVEAVQTASEPPSATEASPGGTTVCPTCQGTGASPGPDGQATLCPTCNGDGVVAATPAG